MTRSISWLVPLLWSAACASSTTVVHTPSRGAAGPCDDLPEKALRRGIEENGPSFNGTSLDASTFGRITQAVSEPGVPASRPGTALRVVRLCKGVALRDHTVRYDVVVAGTRLTAASPLAVDFAGALLLGSDTEGKVVQLRIDQIAPASGARRPRRARADRASAAAGRGSPRPSRSTAWWRVPHSRLRARRRASGSHPSNRCCPGAARSRAPSGSRPP